jgi:ankyrin repeat protein
MSLASRLLGGGAAGLLALCPIAAAAQPAPVAAAPGAPTADGAATAPARGAGRGAAAADAPPAPAEVTPSAGDTRLADAAARQDETQVARLLQVKGVDVNAPGADGSTALHQAVRYGNLGMAAALIQVGANTRQPNRYGLPPLVMAAQDGAAEMIGLLLDNGAEVNATDPAGETALMAAAREGAPQAVALLLDRGAKIDAADPTFGQTALMLAVREDHPAVVDLLIRRGADVNLRTRIGPVPKPRMPGEGGGSHGEGIVRSGIPPQGARPAQPGGMTPLLFAARDGRTESARLLLAAGAKIELADANGMTPLLIALLNAQFATAQLLLANNAAVNVHDYWGRTPLYAAVEVRDREVNGPAKADNGVDRPMALQLVKALLDKGADPNARVKEYPPDRRFIMTLGSLAWVNFTGQTPFVHAALAGDVEVMKLLLQYKADPNIATFNGTTALAAAAGVNWVSNQTWTEGPDRLLEAVKLCVDLGQDVNQANDMGLAPLHGAANRGSNDIIGYLVSKGARLDAKDKVGRTPLVWAGGVFLATNAPEPKPLTEALIKDLLNKHQQAAGDRPAAAGRNRS